MSASRIPHSSSNHSSPRKSQAWAWAVCFPLDRRGTWGPNLGNRERGRRDDIQFYPAAGVGALCVSHALEQIRPIMPLPLDVRSQRCANGRQQLLTVKRFFKVPVAFDERRSAALGARGVRNRMTGNSGCSDRANRRSSNPSISDMPMSRSNSRSRTGRHLRRAPWPTSTGEHRSPPPPANRRATRGSDGRHQRRPPQIG